MVAPVFLAVVVDRVVAVIRRHVLGDDERLRVDGARPRPCWRAVRLAVLVLLYSLRLVLAPRRPSAGLRRLVLNAAPLPGPAPPGAAARAEAAGD